MINAKNRIKEFVFNGMLLKDSLENLERQGIKLFDEKDEVKINRINNSNK